MDDATLKVTKARIADAIVSKIQVMKAAGCTPTEIAAELRKIGDETGLSIAAQFREVLPGIGFMEITIEKPKAGETAAVMTKPEDDCPGPHYPTPCCGTPICFQEAKAVGKPLSEMLEHSVCPKCTSFMKRHGESYDSLSFSCLSMDDVIALPDEDRMRLQRDRRRFEERRPGGL